MVKIYFLVLYIVIAVSIYLVAPDYLNYLRLNSLENLAFANIGLFASLTGFLIASVPFFVQIISKKDYLIEAVDNNLEEIVSTLFILMAIFITSLIYILFDFKQFIYKYIIFSVFVYLYIMLCFYMREIFLILKRLTSDLKLLK